MPSIDPDSLSPVDRYRLMISSVVPRPIAWVTTLFPDGSVNAAPFSYFNGVSSTPPLVSVAVGRRGRVPDGVSRKKDTVTNIERSGELVVNVVSTAAAEAMVGSAVVSETARNGLETVPSETVGTPGLALAPLRLECRVHSLLDLPEAHTTLVLARVLRFVAAEGVLGPDGLADLAALDPLGRLGGENYCRVGDPITVARPGAG
jgi:flavin reductase (DIM6/NTAB) family NADH-FMN oxidoreductase RutF